MQEICKKDMCTGCQACANACPQQCIAMRADAEGFWYPQVDAARCTDCGLCRRRCPALQARAAHETLPKAYACVYPDEAVRAESSSGGFFTLLTRQVLKSGGAVCGAAFDASFGVRHCWAETLQQARAFRGSKYVQSEIGGAYREAERLLKAGRTVLFTGTPCQIGGLRSFLAKAYDNLLAVDIICHGVPSPLVWQRYLAELARERAVRRVNFRDKQAGWRRFSLAVEFADGSLYRSSFREDVYLQGFLQDLYLRPACYQCRYKTAARDSDLTIADFWGVNKTLPQIDDNQGTSLVLVQSEKGREVFASLQPFLQTARADLTAALRYNVSATASATPHQERRRFFAGLEEAKLLSTHISECLAASKK